MDPWRYESAEDLQQPMIERLRRFPREPDMLVYGLRWLAALILRGWLRVYHRLNVCGREHLPSEGSFVIVANHASHLDTLCLLSALPLGKIQRAFPAAAKDYFFVSSPRLLLAAIVVNAMPFERGFSPWQCLGVCEQLLENLGNILILFPEGTRSTTGEIGPFKPGVGFLLAGKEIPVVPCYLEGTHAAWPKGAWLPRPRKVTVHIGAPRKYPHCKPDKQTAQQICQELSEAVSALDPTGPPVEAC